MPRAPLILDLFCGAGLAAEGLIRAGWDVVGVDIAPQARYPAPFLRADALSLDPRFIGMFDAIWASPPCQRDTAMRYAPNAKGLAHPDLITPTRAILRASGKPYVIENVETAPLRAPLILCGSMFGLAATIRGVRFGLERHRKFESNIALSAPQMRCVSPCIGVYGGHARIRAASAGGRRTSEDLGGRTHPDVMREALGCRAGLSANEMSQGIPPAYARHIGILLRYAKALARGANSALLDIAPETPYVAPLA